MESTIIDDPLALFQERLKNIDNHVVIDTMQNITVLAASIGPERVRKELIPLIKSFLDINVDEVLALLATNLYGIYKLGGADEMDDDAFVVIIDVLTILATQEEIVIRNGAIESLSRVCNCTNQDRVITKILPVYFELNQGEWFAPRMSAAGLTPILLHCLPVEYHPQILAVYKGLCNEDTPMTRKAALDVLKYVAVCISETSNRDIKKTGELFESEIYPVLQSIAIDERDYLRILVPGIIAHIIPLIPVVHVTDIMFPLVEGLQQDNSWKIRCALAENFSHIFHSVLLNAMSHEINNQHNILLLGGPLQLSQILEKFFGIYALIFSDSSIEAKGAAVSVFSNVALSLCGFVYQRAPRPRFTIDITSEDTFDFTSTHLIPEIPEWLSPVNETPLTSFLFPGEKLMTKVFTHLGEVANQDSVALKLDLIDQLALSVPLLSVEVVENVVSPIFKKLCVDESMDVRCSVATNLDALAYSCSSSEGETDMVDMLTTLCKDKRWRVRLAAVGQFGVFARIFKDRLDSFDGLILGYVKMLLGEHVHAVRNRVCVEMRVFVEIFGHKEVLDRFYATVTELFDTRVNYLHRLTALDFMFYFVTAPFSSCPGSVILANFLPILRLAIADTVPNVRIHSCKCLQAFIAHDDYLDMDKSVNDTILQLISSLECEVTESEILYQCGLLRRMIDKDGKRVPYAYYIHPFRPIAMDEDHFPIELLGDGLIPPVYNPVIQSSIPPANNDAPVLPAELQYKLTQRFNELAPGIAIHPAQKLNDNDSNDTSGLNAAVSSLLRPSAIDPALVFQELNQYVNAVNDKH